MPRKAAPSVLSADSIFASIMGQLGGVPDYNCSDWDPDMQRFGQAILEVVAANGTLFIRSGSGGQSVGIAIWEGDTRHPAKWLQDAEGIDAWSAAVLQAIPGKTAMKKEDQRS